ncbi:MAG: iron-containing alcohol dehydrogenase [Paracoccaceae bacterium]
MLDDTQLLTPQDWSFPVPIAYGPGRLAELGETCSALGIQRPLIVTDRTSAKLPFIIQLKQILQDKGLYCDLFCDISPNPRDDEIGAGCDLFETGGHDSVIAIGGGSAMDGGKAICLTALNDIDLWDFEFEQPVPVMPKDHSFPKLITVPTTAGTGAETESTAMVTHVKKGMKFCIWHPDLKPSLALLDPELTLALPANLTAWTGVDALTHAVEAYLVPDFHPLCDGLALEALSLISNSLIRAYEAPDDLAARGSMLVGSCLAGIAFMKGLGLVHAISHMVGAEYDTQHGLTNAIVLPTVLRYNLPGLDTKVERMSQAMGLSTASQDAFCAHIEALLDRLNIPVSLNEIGVPESCVERIAEKAMQDSAYGTNPRVADLDEMITLVRSCIKDVRVMS